jgi:hypothetical protein
MRPTSRKEFKEYCLRELGAPVIEVNVSEEQVDDRIDFALSTWWDYHFDGSEKCYYKYILQDKDFPQHLSEIEVANSGIGYSNNDVVVISPDQAGGGRDGAAHIVTDDAGSIISVPIDASGTDYLNPPNVTVVTTTGKGATLIGYNGGYIPIPENIIGAINIFDVASTIWGGSANMFNVIYQIALNDLYTMTNISMVPYYMARTQIQEIGQWFVGKQPVRYNRHRNKLYLDMEWERVGMGGILVVEAYQIVDPDVFRDSWDDRWLKKYATALIKKQWGNNMKKYTGMPLPGGITMNGQQYYNEAVDEIKELEQRMIIDYGYPVTDMIG